MTGRPRASTWVTDLGAGVVVGIILAAPAAFVAGWSWRIFRLAAGW